VLRRVRNYSRNNERAEQIVEPERSQGVFHSQGLDAWLVVRRPLTPPFDIFTCVIDGQISCASLWRRC
jgi:hypothetical protein